MKKGKYFLALICSVALAGIGLTRVQTSRVISTKAANPVAISTIDAWKFAGGWDTTSVYVTQGVKVTIPGADTVGPGDAWMRKAYLINDASLSYAHSLSANTKVTFDISIGMYDAAGNIISQSQNGENIDIIFAKAADLSGEICRIRIWANSGGPLNGSHSFAAYPSGTWNDYGGGRWFWGDCTLGSQYYFEFDKTNIVSTYICGIDGVTSPMLTGDGLDSAKATLGDADNVYIGIAGNNGFTTNMDIILRNLNGQGLSNDGTNFTEDIAPIFVSDTHSPDISIHDEYDIPVVAFDILGPVTYSLQISGNTTPGKKFTPTVAGNLDVRVIATDTGGNEAYKDITFNVLDDMTIDKFATKFLNANVCGLSDSDSLQEEAWASQRTLYQSLSPTLQDDLSNVDTSDTITYSATVIEMMTKYDRVIQLHGVSYDYMGRVANGRIILSPVNNFNLSRTNSSLLLVFTAVALISLLSIFVIRKRKYN